MSLFVKVLAALVVYVLSLVLWGRILYREGFRTGQNSVSIMIQVQPEEEEGIWIIPSPRELRVREHKL